MDVITHFLVITFGFYSRKFGSDSIKTKVVPYSVRAFHAVSTSYENGLEVMSSYLATFFDWSTCIIMFCQIPASMSQLHFEESRWSFLEYGCRVLQVAFVKRRLLWSKQHGLETHQPCSYVFSNLKWLHLLPPATKTSIQPQNKMRVAFQTKFCLNSAYITRINFKLWEPGD